MSMATWSTTPPLEVMAAHPNHPFYAAISPAAGHGLSFNDHKAIEVHELMELVVNGRPPLTTLDTAAGRRRARCRDRIRSERPLERGGKGLNSCEISCYFTAPSVRPRTRWRCTRSAKTTIGRAPRTPAADIEAQSVSMRPISVAVPRGMVMARGVAVSASANRNSLKVDDHREDRGGGKAGRGERQGDAAEGGEARIAVDHRRFLEIDRDLAEEALHHPDAEGDVERRVGDDQPEPGVEQLEPQHQQIDRDQDHHRRHDAQRQQRQPDLALQPEAQTEAGDGIGAERADDERDGDRTRRSPRANW